MRLRYVFVPIYVLILMFVGCRQLDEGEPAPFDAFAVPRDLGRLIDGDEDAAEPQSPDEGSSWERPTDSRGETLPEPTPSSTPFEAVSRLAGRRPRSR